ncbi:hypothetical protein D6D02_10296 [Aureobasidium pullulans]|nr:hypothetical protein D6D02_10296 [Aureobasidium pullulans]THY56893.1 hypothetical protein D6C99_02704 [Aureobasidium pullulans]
MTAKVMSSTSDTTKSAQAQAQQQPQQPGLLQPDMTSPPTQSTANPTPTSTSNNSSQNNHRASIRRSLMSTRSHNSQRSRPTSSVFPIFPSSLSYALVRDFAYPQYHPLHFGPSPEPASRGSDDTSAFSSSRRLSDPPIGSWDTRGWGAGPWGGDGGAQFGAGDQLPSTSFDDDASDDDVTSTGKLAKNHRKSKSAHESRGRSTTKRGPRNQVPGLDSQGFFAAGPDDDEEEEETEDESSSHNKSTGGTLPAHRYTHSPEGLSSRHHARLSALEPPFSDSSDPADAPGGPLHHLHDGHAHRPTSTSLDESFAGPSLALYNFVPENSNELALREGQIIQVGYRHGQGWLVAMDLESGEQGLVPEEYVRLLSEIEGWGDHLEGVEEEGEGSFEEELAEEVHAESQERDTNVKAAAIASERSGGGGGGGGGGQQKDMPVREKSVR